MSSLVDAKIMNAASKQTTLNLAKPQDQDMEQEPKCPMYMETTDDMPPFKRQNDQPGPLPQQEYEEEDDEAEEEEPTQSEVIRANKEAHLKRAKAKEMDKHNPSAKKVQKKQTFAEPVCSQDTYDEETDEKDRHPKTRQILGKRALKKADKKAQYAAKQKSLEVKDGIVNEYPRQANPNAPRGQGKRETRASSRRIDDLMVAADKINYLKHRTLENSYVIPNRSWMVYEPPKDVPHYEVARIEAERLAVLEKAAHREVAWSKVIYDQAKIYEQKMNEVDEAFIAYRKEHMKGVGEYDEIKRQLAVSEEMCRSQQVRLEDLEREKGPELAALNNFKEKLEEESEPLIEPERVTFKQDIALYKNTIRELHLELHTVKEYNNSLVQTVMSMGMVNTAALTKVTCVTDSLTRLQLDNGQRGPDGKYFGMSDDPIPDVKENPGYVHTQTIVNNAAALHLRNQEVEKKKLVAAIEKQQKK